MASAQKESSNNLPPLFQGEICSLVSVKVNKKKTKPPELYTEGTLLQDMVGAAKFVLDDPLLKRSLKESSGLGTSATRDATIEGLKHDGYIAKSGKYIEATEKGTKFIHWLDRVAPDLTNVALTARWEAELAVVAKEGGGAAFEKRVISAVESLINSLKSAAPLEVGYSKTSTSGTSSMTDTTTPRANKPTDKMMEFAKNIAQRVGARLPDDALTDFDACRAFIDLHKDVAMRPTDKQVNFAKNIAERAGLTIPPETLANGRELSAWIDQHK